jgi:hypothetical protein
MIKFTPTSASDHAQIAEWIAKDPDHQKHCTPEFWLPSKNTECFRVEDDQGPVFFVRAENVLRLHIQFSDNRKRNARAINEFTDFIRENSRARGYKQIIFESVFKPLIRFLDRRGFHASPNEMVTDL